MTPTRGNPLIAVRVEPEFMERFQSAFPAVKGRSGGGSLALRRLLYAVLDEPMPRQFGEIGRARDVDELEELLRALESRETVGGAALAQSQSQALEILAADESDAVDKLRLYAVLGRLWLLEADPPKKKS